MHVHILGIAGTFMGGLAVLASELKYKVTGADQAIYPPMSTQLENLGIELTEGYENSELNPMPDCIVVGNVMRRGLPIIESLLNKGVPFISGPEFLARYILPKRHVIAVSGTHGKTTTTSMVAWILEVAGLQPGFLIGGVPLNFGLSARLGKMPCFVVEADEYDSAFFDKRSKFIHYRPNTLIMNNIEYDHADIFPNLAAIETQFHHLVRTVPGNGLIVYPSQDEVIDRVLSRGSWTPKASFSLNSFGSVEAGWYAKKLNEDGSCFDVYYEQTCHGRVEWSLLGQHNIANALAAIIAATHVGVAPETAIKALGKFLNVKRRLETRGQVADITLYDDFAHHPTAIATTLAGLRAKVGNNAISKIIAVVEIRSNTMKLGHHQEELSACVKDACEVYFVRAPSISWDVDQVFKAANKPGGVYTDVNELVNVLVDRLAVKPQAYDKNDKNEKGQNLSNNLSRHVVMMSNGGFGGIHQLMLEKLQTIN